MQNPTQIKSVLKHIDRLMQDYDKQRDNAVSQRLWSQVSGLDGIATGLALAKKIIDQEVSNMLRKS